MLRSRHLDFTYAGSLASRVIFHRSDDGTDHRDLFCVDIFLFCDVQEGNEGASRTRGTKKGETRKPDRLDVFIMPHRNILDISKMSLLVVDIQEAFRHSVKDFAVVASRVSTAIRAFDLLGIEPIVTEQYPKGLGRTAEEILLSLPDDPFIVEKTTFSAGMEERVLERLRMSNATQILICGLETHICVSQTAHDLLDQGFEVHVLTDCVASRFDHDRQAGLSKMQASGTIPSSMEMALFELIRDSRDERFREIQALIK